MGFELFENGKKLLRNEDNAGWIDKIACWIEKESGYNIYIFQLVAQNQEEIEEYYEKITASIAVDFQAGLEKAIEKWNIYLIFECREKVDWEIKEMVEHDKYAVRKLIWDEMKPENLNDKEYIRNRLLYLDIDERTKNTNEKISLMEKLKEKDCELYNILQKEKVETAQMVAMYIGDGIDE